MAKGERTSQKQRTRHDLLQAASRLMAQGQLPKVADVAKEALVSRATAYRFFSSDEALIAEAAVDVRTPTATELFEGIRRSILTRGCSRRTPSCTTSCGESEADEVHCGASA